MARFSRNEILELIRRFPEGARLEEVMLGLSPQMSRRTLQRRLSQMVRAGELEVIGQARARRYRVVRLPAAVARLIPLSSEGEQIEAAVTRPIQRRSPVPYHREFLDSYCPNQTFYLSEVLRVALRKMGESKGGTYPAGTYARQIFSRILIDLAWNSSRLEGNTYSLIETIRLLEEGMPAVGKGLKETQMILNHKAAIEFLIQSAEEIEVNRYTLLSLHALLSDNLLPDPASSGRLRTIPVAIAHSVYQPPIIPQIIGECFGLVVQKASAIVDPFEQAFFLMVQLPYLQPFDDVNKRTSRLAANIPLIRGNYCPLSFIDVPEELYIHALLGIYELNRVELLRDLFVWAYERSCALYATARQTLGEPDPFRLQYRAAIREAVRDIILKGLGQEKAVQTLRERATQLPESDRARFLEAVERELLSLHEGNLARYQLRPSEFHAWKKIF